MAAAVWALTAATRHGALVKHKAEVSAAREEGAPAGRAASAAATRTRPPPALAFLLPQVARSEAKFEADFKAFIASEAASEAATE